MDRRRCVRSVLWPFHRRFNRLNMVQEGYIFCSEAGLLLCRIVGAYSGDIRAEYCTPGELFELLCNEVHALHWHSSDLVL